jgi:hypothetical protein
MSSNVGFIDSGSGVVGSGTAYRRLRGQFSPTGMSAKLAGDIEKRSKTDIGLDPITFLPAVLAYSVHPDNGAPIQVAIEVHYSDYRTVDGTQIPFHIERYVNGYLQLDIHVTSAEVN